ncbi:MAG: hypothetical protein PUB74_02945 [Bifidobacterium boum]|nr:hypothetical protein [Bifidobacterium boum]
MILTICLVLGGLVKAGVIKPSSDPSRATSITYAQGMPSSQPSSSGSLQTRQDGTDLASSDSSDSTGIIGYRYDSSDQYRQYVNEIKAMHDKYHAMPAAQINEYVKALPDAQSAIDTWLKTLDHMLEATSYGDARRSMNRDAATTYYNAKLTDLHQLEYDFKINRAYRISIETNTTATGSYFEIVFSQDESHHAPSPQQLDTIEQQIAAFQGQPGQDGTYMQSGEQMLSIAGLHADYDFQSIGNYCPSMTADQYTFAAYCEKKTDTVFVNTGHEAYPYIVRSPQYLDELRHEIAHYLVYSRCDTAAPPLHTETEGMANSYAVMYLGANRDTLNSTGASFPAYAMNEQTDQAAASAHAGTCVVD